MCVAFSGCQILKPSAINQKTLPRSEDSQVKTDSVVDVRGVATSQDFVEFQSGKLTLSELVRKTVDKGVIESGKKWENITNSRISYDNLFVRLQRSKQLIIMPLRMAELSDFGRMLIQDGDILTVVLDSTRLGTENFDLLSRLPFDIDKLSAKEVNRKLIDTINKLSDSQQGTIGKKDNQLGWHIKDTTWTSALSAISQSEENIKNAEPPLSESEIATETDSINKNFQTANEQFNKWKAKRAVKPEAKTLGKSITVFFDKTNLGTTKIEPRTQTVASLIGKLQNLAEMVIVTRIIDNNQNKFIENTILPIKIDRESLGMKGAPPVAQDLKHMKLKPNDIVTFYSTPDVVPLVRQAKLQPQIERILRRRNEKLNQGRRALIRYRTERQRRFPISSRLPASFGAYIRPVEAGFSNASQNLRNFARPILRN